MLLHDGYEQSVVAEEAELLAQRCCSVDDLGRNGQDVDSVSRNFLDGLAEAG